MRTENHIRSAALAVIGACALSAFSIAGSPEPPVGPVGSTMKTLEEVEPRIALSQENTPGDASSLFIISQSGSYYLTGDTTVSGRNGIMVTASEVTIDLMGYTLRGDASPLRDGIRVEGAFQSLLVRNGMIKGWGEDGIHVTSSNSAARFVSLIVSSNHDRGIVAPGSSIVRDCIASFNGSDGIVTFSGSIIRDCACGSNGGRGISADLACLIVGCDVSFNSVGGIYALEGSSVRDCVSRANTPAIEVTDDCRVTNNACDLGGTGILVTGTGSRIDSNRISDSTAGIEVSGSGNLIIRNSVTGGTTEYSIVANNKVGTIVSAPNSGAISGSTGGAGVGTTDPWANIAY